MADDYSIFKERMAALSGAIFLFGLAGLFLVHAIWPGVMFLIWMTSVPVLLAEKGWRYGLWLVTQAALWLVGVPLLIQMGLIFPGVLFLAGTSALLVAIAPPEKLEAQHTAWRREVAAQQKAKRKRKRGLPLPPVEPKLAEALDYNVDSLDDDDDYVEGEIDDPALSSSSGTGSPPAQH